MALGRDVQLTGQRLVVYGALGGLALVGAFLMAGFAVFLGIFVVGLATVLGVLYAIGALARWRLGEPAPHPDQGRIIDADYTVVEDRRERRRD